MIVKKKKQTTKKRGIVAIQGKTITLLFTINITTFLPCFERKTLTWPLSLK